MQPPCDPANNSLYDRRVSDHVLPLGRAGMTLVVLLHPIGLEHHTIAWADVFIR